MKPYMHPLTEAPRQLKSGCPVVYSKTQCYNGRSK